MFVALPLGAAVAAGAETGAATMESRAAGRLLVQTRAGADPDAVVADARRLAGAERGRRRRIRGLNVHVVDAASDRIEQLRAALAADPRVSFVERDRVVPPALLASDPLFTEQDHLAAIDAPEAWVTSTGSAAMPIAVLDTGVDATHPDLAARVLPGHNVFDDDDDSDDVIGHGTAVAGVIAAATDNGIGTSGITWLNPILPIRITDRGGNASYSTIADGLVWAADHGARIANLSFAVFGAHSIEAAAQYFVQKGGLVFAAGGNDALGHRDAANDWVLSVAATDGADALADFSSYGDYIDLSAPGVDVLTTRRGGGYARVSGTSIASPIAAGVAALVMAANPSLAPVQIADVLQANAADLGDPGWDAHFGWGRIDAASAVAAAEQMDGGSDTIAPSVRITAPGAGHLIDGAVTVEVDARDDRAVASVELWVDGELYAAAAAEPFSFAWDTKRAANGAHRLSAIARDASGNAANSTACDVTVANSTDAPAPRVRVRAVRSRSGAIAVRVSAHAATGIRQVALFVDGSCVAVKADESVRGLRYVIATSALSGGSHEVVAVAEDAGGESGISRTLTIGDALPSAAAPR